MLPPRPHLRFTPERCVTFTPLDLMLKWTTENFDVDNSSRTDKLANVTIYGLLSLVMKTLVWLCFLVAVASAGYAAPDGSVATPHDRALGLEGAPNFRDIGGYATAKGQHVRWGKVYRSNDLSKLTTADVDRVAALDLVSVIDLRTEEERQHAPSIWLHAPADIYPSAKTTLAPVMHTILTDAATPEGARAGIIKFYTQMPDEYHDEYAAMFHRIAAGKLPILVHCTAGKDRTGVAMAVLLTTLGVPRQTVVEDYALTEKLVPAPAAAAQHPVPVGGAAAPLSPLARLSAESREVLWRSDPAYISAALDSIDREYGSVDVYVKRELGVSKAEVWALRAKLLQ
jgi:protein-tyrosine phosphatase